MKKRQIDITWKTHNQNEMAVLTSPVTRSWSVIVWSAVSSKRWFDQLRHFSFERKETNERMKIKFVLTCDVMGKWNLILLITDK